MRINCVRFQKSSSVCQRHTYPEYDVYSKVDNCSLLPCTDFSIF